MQVTVIIVNYNSNDFLERCVEGLLAQTFKDFRAVIVDNGSEDCSIEKLGTLPDSFEVIRNERTLDSRVRIILLRNRVSRSGSRRSIPTPFRSLTGYSSS